MASVHNSVFWGTPQFALDTLETLKKGGFLPSLIVTAPDAPSGRGLVITPPPVKLWAQKNGIPVLQPKSFSEESFISELKERGGSKGWDFFLVTAYGKIIPKIVLDIPHKGVLNIHPSLLPLLRGASPIEEAILSASETGVTLMRVDEKMDHGPIVAQEVLFEDWPMRENEAKKILAEMGARLFLNVLPEWIAGNIDEQEQDEGAATYTKQIKKEDGRIDLNDSAETNYRKFLAYFRWPGIYFFANRRNKTIRVNIKEAQLQDGKFTPVRVVPEGKKEMAYEDFLRGL